MSTRTDTELRVVEIFVRNVLGARELALQPGGSITLLAGRNGSGKSTALNAVQAALGGGNLAKLARVPTVEEVAALAPGTEPAEPEVVLLLEGPGNEAYRVERKGAKVRVRSRVGDTAAFEDVGQPATWLRGLYDPEGANPVAFLLAKDADRARLLLEALPLTYNRAELLAAMGMPESALPPVPAGLHPLEEIGLYRDSVFRTRTGVNRDRDGKLRAAEQVRRSTPATSPTDPGPEAEAAADEEVSALGQQIARTEEATRAAEEAARTAAQTEYERTTAEVSTSFKRDAAAFRAEHDRVAAEIRAEAERRIRDRAAKMEGHIADLRTAGDALLDAAERTRDAALAATVAARQAADEGLNATREAYHQAKVRRAALASQREVAAGARALHEQAKRFDDQAAVLEVESDRLTLALTALDEFSRHLSKDLPIQGLEIVGREIRVNGVLYEQLNTAQRVDIAVRVACLRAKGQRLPVVFVDGTEALDDDQFRLLVERLDAEGVQAFIGRVETHDLKVATDAAAAGA